MDRVFIAADQQGFFLKEKIKRHFYKKIAFTDLGVLSAEPVYYLLVAIAIGQNLSKVGNGEKGLLFCNDSVGMSKIINKFSKVKSATVFDEKSAKFAREKYNANIACMGVKQVNEMLATRIIDIFLSTEFKGNRQPE